MWQTITMAILHVIKRDLTQHCGLIVWRWNLILNFLERHWSYRGQGDCARGKESFLLALIKENISIVKTIEKYKIKGMCEHFRRSIHLQTCFVLQTQRHWRKKPLYLRCDGGGGVVLSVCDCRALADFGSCFALVAVRLGGFIGDCLHLRRGFVCLRLQRFTFVIYNDFTTGGKRKEKFVRSVFQSSVRELPLFILFPRIGSPKNDCSVVIYSPSCSFKPMSFFLFSVEHKRFFDETEGYARHSFQYNESEWRLVLNAPQMT